ncbi:MAG: choice-of-anchor J domain-containing protein [Crocinitomicaceae bacterium]|nr:choice-of-anchor J domain-containing protein [Crocinitomicaceae bacterium]
MKKIITSIFTGLLLSATIHTTIKAQAINEGFDDITTLVGAGWVQQNNSTTIGSTAWFQGNPISGGGPFDAFNGATNAYIGVNYNSTTGANDISNWLVTPNRTIKNGDVIQFYTRTYAPTTYADRLEVRLSTNGASTNVGVGSAAVGDFTTLLLSINPTLNLTAYPTTWTQYTITISGLSAPTSGRFALRYFVTNGGPLGANSDFIGLDNFIYTPYVCPTLTMTSAGALIGGTAGSAYSTTLTQTGALGTPTFAVTSGALPSGLSLSTAGTISGTPTDSGTFNFTVTVSDNSGCSTATAYSITVVCPPNPTSLNGLPTLCSNAGLYNLTQGLPAGGTYSGTGVSGPSFDPSIGTQTITYNYTDIYGCVYSSSNQITVNTAPTVSLGAFSDVCSNAGIFALTGGSPVGGTYSGTGVTGTDFDPTVGNQNITYSYTDGNSCSNSAISTILVNTAPSVSHPAVADVCENADAVTLIGGLPAGGTYTGTGITGADFDPTVGTQSITYSYTDVNSCSDATTFSITVIPSETATLMPFVAVCDNIAPIALAGGMPAGGVYSGTGVTGGDFDPSVGTQTISYTVGVGTSCESVASEILSVNAAPIVGLTLNPTSVCVYDASYTLTGGSPAGGTYTGTGVSAGSFNPSTAGIGSTSLNYTYVDVNGCSNSANASITIDGCVSIEEMNNVTFTIYPNPASSTFNISSSDVINSFELAIYDMTGKKLRAESQLNGDSVIEFSLLNMNAGLYYVKGIINNQNVNLSITIK